MDDILLDIKNLNIEFHDHDAPEHVVKNVNMVLKRGEILGIVGESGSGKSLTAMAIAGLLRRHDITTDGRIIFDGKELLGAKRSDRVAGRRKPQNTQTRNGQGAAIQTCR